MQSSTTDWLSINDAISYLVPQLDKWETEQSLSYPNISPGDWFTLSQKISFQCQRISQDGKVISYISVKGNRRRAPRSWKTAQIQSQTAKVLHHRRQALKQIQEAFSDGRLSIRGKKPNSVTHEVIDEGYRVGGKLTFEIGRNGLDGVIRSTLNFGRAKKEIIVWHECVVTRADLENCWPVAKQSHATHESPSVSVAQKRGTGEEPMTPKPGSTPVQLIEGEDILPRDQRFYERYKFLDDETPGAGLVNISKTIAREHWGSDEKHETVRRALYVIRKANKETGLRPGYQNRISPNSPS